MKVANRQLVIELLKSGKEMIKSQWGSGYYIGLWRVRCDTAQNLIRDGLVVVADSRLKFFWWNPKEEDGGE